MISVHLPRGPGAQWSREPAGPGAVNPGWWHGPPPPLRRDPEVPTRKEVCCLQMYYCLHSCKTFVFVICSFLKSSTSCLSGKYCGNIILGDGVECKITTHCRSFTKFTLCTTGATGSLWFASIASDIRALNRTSYFPTHK